MNKPLLVSLNEKFYDVTEFAKKHPGGEKVLRKVAGGDIEHFMNGSKRILNIKHQHSDAAYNMLKRYSLEKNLEKDSLIDSQSGILWKIGDLKQDYWRWIHQPYDGTLRLFDSDFLEGLTRTTWWTIIVIWLPVVCFFSSIGCNILYQHFGLIKGCFISSFFFASGTLMWTLLEYSLHRGVFHWKPNQESYNQITLHFLLHGLHHKTPMDGDRLVFPPAAALILISIFYVFYRLLFPWPYFCLFASGQLFGYICYDIMHYYLHHGSPKPYTSMYFRKVYHHNHHFKDFDLAFGITTLLWDYVFGTVGSGPL